MMRRVAMMMSVMLVALIGAGSIDAPATAPTPGPVGTDPAAQETAGEQTRRAAVVYLDGDINDYNKQALETRFQLARQAGAEVVIMQVDTYGGYVDAGLAISRFVKRQSDLHVIAYIPVKAISAGALIAVAADEIVMEPGAQIGNSGVVTGTGQELSGTNRAKAESMVVDDFDDSARRNGYDPLLLQSMVIVERVVYFIEHTDSGERRFVDADEYKELAATKEWRPVPGVRNPLDAADSLFTAGSELAHRIGLASEIASDLDSFIASRGYQHVGTFAPGFGDHVIAFLNGFAVRGILTTVLLISLYMAFSTPGQGLPEVAAAIALGVLFGVPLLTGYAGWIEIVAVVLGIVLIAVEIFILPGFGLPGITGVLLVLGALVMTFAPPITLPEAPGGFAMPWGHLQRGLVVVLIAMAASLLLWWWLSRFLPKMPYLNRLILTAGGPQTATAGAGGGAGAGIGIDEEPWPPIGAVGRAVTDLRPGGSAEFHDHLINDVRLADVVCDCGFVAHGTEIKVREVHGNRIVVRPVS